MSETKTKATFTFCLKQKIQKMVEIEEEVAPPAGLMLCCVCLVLPCVRPAVSSLVFLYWRCRVVSVLPCFCILLSSLVVI